MSVCKPHFEQARRPDKERSTKDFNKLNKKSKLCRVDHQSGNVAPCNLAK